MDAIIDRLLASNEPSIQYKIRTGVLGESRPSGSIKELRLAIKNSPRVKQLLVNRGDDGLIKPPFVYRKWIGCHWILATLADIGYPTNDESLRPAINQVLTCWLNPEGIREFVCQKDKSPNRMTGVPIINGRARRCATQQGNGLFSAIALGLVDDRIHQLAELLIRWQWPDGGWNCDRRPEACHSSFSESHIPLRALGAYVKLTKDAKAKKAMERAAQLFLQRRLYRRLTNGNIINSQFTKLHYPCYWRYDILFGLKIMAEAGFIDDPRCRDALDLLESKRLPDGGWPAQQCFYRASESSGSGRELVTWGKASQRKMNESVTADALTVLKAANRLK